jgi:hypothetical protein
MMGQDCRGSMPMMAAMAGHVEGRLAFLKTELKITDAALERGRGRDPRQCQKRGRDAGSLATTVPALGGGTLVSTYSSRVTDNILRLGVNYKFGGPGIGAY